jgi:hypothetical protein
VSEIPKLTVTFGNLKVNGKAVKVKEVTAVYPKNVPDYAEATADDGNVVVEVGEAVENRKERNIVLIGKHDPPRR